MVNRVYHLDRGYEAVEQKLAACGADIERLREDWDAGIANFAWNGHGPNPILVPTRPHYATICPLEMPVSVLLPAPLTCCRWELERRHMVPPSNDALRQVIET